MNVISEREKEVQKGERQRDSEAEGRDMKEKKHVAGARRRKGRGVPLLPSPTVGKA